MQLSGLSLKAEVDLARQAGQLRYVLYRYPQLLRAWGLDCWTPRSYIGDCCLHATRESADPECTVRPGTSDGSAGAPVCSSSCQQQPVCQHLLLADSTPAGGAVHCLAAVASGAHSRSALEAHPLWARRLSAAAPTEPLDDLVSGMDEFCLQDVAWHARELQHPARKQQRFDTGCT